MIEWSVRSSALVPLATFIVAACLLGCGPLGPIPGGHLRGDVGASAVRDWDFAADEKTAQLETSPDDPHSVNVWFASIGSRLYVPTSMILGPKDPTEREWVENALESPLVRIRVEGAVYERNAVRVADPGEYAEARAALETKYELEPDERDAEREVWIFRLDPRG